MKTRYQRIYPSLMLVAACLLSACTTETESASEETVATVKQAATAPITQKMFAMGTSIYVVTRDAELLWYGDLTQNGSWGWDPNSGNVIGDYWNHRLVFSGGGGVIYAVDDAGNLHWYKHTSQNHTPVWAPNSGAIIASGWNIYKSAFADQNGNIYGIENNGTLRWHRDVNRNGTSGWAANYGGAIGSGWDAMQFTTADANGVIYAVDPSGNLRWYRDVAQSGYWSWASNSGNIIGTGWGAPGVKSVIGAGNGVLYAVMSSGDLRYYRDLNRAGSWGWSSTSGNTIGTGWSNISYVPPLADFGYGAMKVNGRSATGTRPTMVFVASYTNFPALSRDWGYFSNLIFGDSQVPPYSYPFNPRSVRQFVNDNSNGRLFIGRAGTGVNMVQMGTTTQAGDPEGDDPELRLKAIFTQASANGFNFATYDTNGDGIVAEDELLVVVAENWPGASPANRGNAPVTLNGKSIRVRAAMINESTSFSSVSHEFMHSLGAKDLRYDDALGPGIRCLSNNVTLMSCTDFNNQLQDSKHLDAWHKFQLGWIEPRVHRLTTSGIGNITGRDSTSDSFDADGAAIFWSRQRGKQEFFLLEKRTNSLSYDANVGGSGVVIWHVNASIAGTDGLVALGSPSLAQGTGNLLWQSGSTTPVLTWKDGSSTGTSFGFALHPLLPTDYFVHWF